MSQRNAVHEQGSTSRQGCRWLAQLVLVSTLALVLAGCATFVYKRLDWLAVWYVNGLVSLDESQESLLRAVVRDTLEWHRATQLPLYRAYLAQLDLDTDAAMPAELVARRYEEMVALWDPLVRRMADDLAPLLGSFTAEQRDELMASLEEDNEEIWQQYAGSTPEVRRKRQTKTTIRVIQRFMGRLTDAQKELLGVHLAGLHDLAEAWLTRRRAWQTRLREVLEENASDVTLLRAAVQDLALRPEQFDPPEYRRLAADNRHMVFAMLADLSASMTPVQRERMGRKLREYADDLDALTRPN